MNVLGVPRVLYLFVPAYVANMSPVLGKGRFVMLAVPMDEGATVVLYPSDAIADGVRVRVRESIRAEAPG